MEAKGQVLLVIDTSGGLIEQLEIEGEIAGGGGGPLPAHRLILLARDIERDAWRVVIDGLLLAVQDEEVQEALLGVAGNGVDVVLQDNRLAISIVVQVGGPEDLPVEPGPFAHVLQAELVGPAVEELTLDIVEPDAEGVVAILGGVPAPDERIEGLACDVGPMLDRFDGLDVGDGAVEDGDVEQDLLGPVLPGVDVDDAIHESVTAFDTGRVEIEPHELVGQFEALLEIQLLEHQLPGEIGYDDGEGIAIRVSGRPVPVNHIIAHVPGHVEVNLGEVQRRAALDLAHGDVDPPLLGPVVPGGQVELEVDGVLEGIVALVLEPVEGLVEPGLLGEGEELHIVGLKMEAQLACGVVDVEVE